MRKSIIRLFFIPIIQNISHNCGLPLLEMTKNSFSESLYFDVGPYIGPILSLHYPYFERYILTWPGWQVCYS